MLTWVIPMTHSGYRTRGPKKPSTRLLSSQRTRTPATTVLSLQRLRHNTTSGCGRPSLGVALARCKVACSSYVTVYFLLTVPQRTVL